MTDKIDGESRRDGDGLIQGSVYAAQTLCRRSGPSSGTGSTDMNRIRTKRWTDPPEADDGTRIFIGHYWPRRLHREDAPWDAWMRPLAPSRQLHADFMGKNGPPIDFVTEYTPRYLAEMEAEIPRRIIADLACRVAAGETITLLCFCADENQCHRTLLKQLIEDEAKRIKLARRPAPYCGAAHGAAEAHR